MTDYQKYINALRKCAKEHENDRTSTGHIIISDLCRDTANLLEALEQEPRSEWEHDHEILKAYSDGASDVLDKIRAEIESIDLLAEYTRGDIKRMALDVIDKYKAESENA